MADLSCVELFKLAADQLQIPYEAKDFEFNQTQTVFMSETSFVQDILWELIRRGSWSSQVSTNGRDVHGDPRFLILILGPVVARYLGFEEFSEKLVLPSPEEFNRRLDLLNLPNEALSKLRFDLLPQGQQIQDPLSYLEGFLRSRLPISRDGIAQIHDISYHYSAFLLPDSVVRYAQSLTYFVVSLAHSISRLAQGAGHFTVEEKLLLDKIGMYLIERRAFDIDTGTGNLPISHLTLLFNPEADPASCLEELVTDHLLRGGMSPKSFFEQELRQSKSAYFSFLNRVGPRLRELLTAHIEGFIQRLSRENKAFGTPFSVHRNLSMAESICREYHDKRMRIVNRVAELSSR